jgi:hypothetical protein
MEPRRKAVCHCLILKFWIWRWPLSKMAPSAHIETSKEVWSTVDIGSPSASSTKVYTGHIGKQQTQSGRNKLRARESQEVVGTSRRKDSSWRLSDLPMKTIWRRNAFSRSAKWNLKLKHESRMSALMSLVDNENMESMSFKKTNWLSHSNDFSN